ncbi:MAG: hypothetical protein JEZ02_10590 [Desulfatibacillum sp.]|nr:hypothetical protein [Desulfatibacillum sp.]
MKIRGGSTIVRTALFIGLFLGLFSGSALAGDSFSRMDKWEVFALAQYMGEDTVRTYIPAYEALRADGTIEQEAEAGFAGGFGVGRMVHEYININGAFSYGQVDLINRGGRDDTFFINSKERVKEIRCTSHQWTIGVNMEGYLFPDSFPGTSLKITPMIAGGVGTKYIHGQWDRTNLKIRDYILTTSAAAGLRWDFDPFFLKVLYQTTWYRMTDTEDSYQSKGYMCHFGYAF